MLERIQFVLEGLSIIANFENEGLSIYSYVGILTRRSESELSADDIGIAHTPEVIADGSPGVIVAYLNTSIQISVAISKTNITIITTYAHKHGRERME